MTDEEKSQQKALWYCWNTSNIGLRGFHEPEACHPKWNGVKAAMRAASLEVAALKGTMMSNWSHGPYNSGQLRMTGEEALRLKLRHQATPEWLLERADLISFDTGIPLEDADHDLIFNFFAEACDAGRTDFAT